MVRGTNIRSGLLLSVGKTILSENDWRLFCITTLTSRAISEPDMGGTMRADLRLVFRHPVLWQKDVSATRLRITENLVSARISIFQEHFL
jgi:hypothetical protein